MKKMTNRGNAFMEYLMIAILVAVGAVWFFDGGNWRGARANVDTSFTNLINEIVTP